MNKRKRADITKYLEEKWREAIRHIVDEYGDCIPPERQKYILNFKNFCGNLILTDIGSCAGMAHGDRIFLNSSINKIFSVARFVPLYKIANLSKKFKPRDLTNPKNNIFTYAAHCFFDGIGTKGCMEEVLLHEVMHFAGANGATPIAEGLTELKTREIARKRILKATGTGYPNEVAVVIELQNFIGKEVLDRITFSENPPQTYSLLFKHGGDALVDLWRACEITMQRESDRYGQLSTINSLLNKLNYNVTYQIIEEYKKASKTGDFSEFYEKIKENNIIILPEMTETARRLLFEGYAEIPHKQSGIPTEERHADTTLYFNPEELNEFADTEATEITQ